MFELCNSDNLLIIRTNISHLCKYQGIKLKQVSESIGVNESYFREVWSGKRKLNTDMLNRIADILKTTPDYLMGLTDNPNSVMRSYDDIMRDNADLRRLVDRLTETGPETWNKVSKFLDMIET